MCAKRTAHACGCHQRSYTQGGVASCQKGEARQRVATQQRQVYGVLVGQAQGLGRNEAVQLAKGHCRACGSSQSVSRSVMERMDQHTCTMAQ